METWRVYILELADSNHFDGSRIRIRIQVRSWIRFHIIKVKNVIRIRIEVLRIRNPGC
jgi:hypothetical protein